MNKMVLGAILLFACVGSVFSMEVGGSAQGQDTEISVGDLLLGAVLSAGVGAAGSVMQHSATAGSSGIKKIAVVGVQVGGGVSVPFFASFLNAKSYRKWLASLALNYICLSLGYAAAEQVFGRGGDVASSGS